MLLVGSLKNLLSNPAIDFCFPLIYCVFFAYTYFYPASDDFLLRSYVLRCLLWCSLCAAPPFGFPFTSPSVFYFSPARSDFYFTFLLKLKSPLVIASPLVIELHPVGESPC